MAHDGFGPHELLALLGQAEKEIVLAKARVRRALEALALDAQHVYHIELGQRRVEVARDFIGP